MKNELMHIKLAPITYKIVATFIYAFASFLYCQDSTGTVKDIDDNVYKTVKIGNQWWMAENLKVTHYRNGDRIPKVTDNTEWDLHSADAYCVYDNNKINADTYGYLYTWYAVNDKRNIAPEGWHVPTKYEWQILKDYLGGRDIAGSKLKETDTTHWESPNEGATNESGFTALPGGYRTYDGYFRNIGRQVYFWSSTDYLIYWADSEHLRNTWSEAFYHGSSKQCGYAVRLIRDK